MPEGGFPVGTRPFPPLEEESLLQCLRVVMLIYGIARHAQLLYCLEATRRSELLFCWPTLPAWACATERMCETGKMCVCLEVKANDKV